MDLRQYQVRACNAVQSAWSNGHRSVCLVAPTGSGKTVMGCELVQRRNCRSLWIAHRRELVTQAAERLRAIFGRLAVGIISPGHPYEPFAQIQVATVQTLLARKDLPPADLVTFDECHHYIAEDWAKLAERYPRALFLGLTATPERQDGKPLGDMFSRLIVAASYSELLDAGHLVQCRVYQPPQHLGRDLAQDPLGAWKRYAENAPTFYFCGSVKRAEEEAQRFTEAGVPAATVTAKTPRRDRDERIAAFKRGAIRVLVNVYALTEGVDVPSARCVLLARGCRHVGMFLQIAGRILRPHPSKPDSILIDLSGATLQHGMPTADRTYSLEGEGIRLNDAAQPLRNCLHCGATLPAQQRVCPECGHEHVPVKPKPPRIYSLELREVYDGADTPDDAKQREYKRLREVGREKGWSPYFVVKEYRRLFNEDVQLTDASDDEKRAEYERLVKIQRERGYKPGFVGVRFKNLFGKWPPREWRERKTA